MCIIVLYENDIIFIYLFILFIQKKNRINNQIKYEMKYIIFHKFSTIIWIWF